MVAKPRGLFKTILYYIPALIIVALFFFPLFWMFSTSFKLRIDWYSLPPRILGFTPTLDNFDQILAIAIVPLNVVIDPATGQPKINKLTGEPQLQRPSQVLPSDAYSELTRFNFFGQWYLVGTKSTFIRFLL